ncbi:MAG: ornithine cyclodeaminase family protein, partial [Phycisphaerales bacterium]|nr:ornithine cyclodeaminase family protein [Phycisphaerales bacterium]
ASRLASDLRVRFEDLEVEVVPTASEAVREADIVCTLTPSESPLFDDEALKGGVHLNAVGAFRPVMCELPPATVRRARVFVDQRAAAVVEAGDLIQAVDAGQFSWDDVAGEIGEVASGGVQGRTSDDEVTLFKSVGMSLQDAACAGAALRHASGVGLGTLIDWP